MPRSTVLASLSLVLALLAAACSSAEDNTSLEESSDELRGACGGVADLGCKAGYACALATSEPDAMGVCKKVCGGPTNIACSSLYACSVADPRATGLCWKKTADDGGANAVDLATLADADLTNRCVAYGHWLRETGKTANAAARNATSPSATAALIKSYFPQVLPKQRAGSDVLYGDLFRAPGGRLERSDPSTGIVEDIVTRPDHSPVPTFVSMWSALLFYSPTYLDPTSGAMYLGNPTNDEVTGPFAPPPKLAIAGKFSARQIGIIQAGISTGLRTP